MEKGIKNFDLLKTIKSTSINAREEGTDEGYVIDTTTIYRYTSQNNKITYSFKIYPIYEVLEDKEYYNLVYEKYGDEWNEIIFKNKEKDTIVSGEPKTESSEMIYYKGFNTSITISDFCQTITYDYHCTQEAPYCTPGNCDGCSICVSESISYWPCEEATTLDQTITEPISGSSAGAGSGGNALSGIYIPNPYNGDADLNNAEFILACQVTAYTNILSQNFPSIGATLTYNPWMHSNIIDFVRNNGNELTPDNQNAIFFALNNIPPMMSFNPSCLTFVEINQLHYNSFINLLNNPTAEMVNFNQQLINYPLVNTITYLPFFKYPQGSNYSTLYPNFTMLVKEYIPALKSDTRLINTIHNLTSVSNSQIINGLTWGNGPEIHITDLGNDPGGNPYYGKFNKNEPERIYIDIELVNLLETLSNNPNPTQNELQLLGNLNAMIVFSVCLH
ncbi:hypothetical protein IVB69_06060 [Flavobacterium sp. J49]|uniref:hypothetical protein n=1 Tax=Flavobacterium sp. J49 TaxID=2718534 RepID=UPI00159410E3|nr:hypothetical protein [Flavobacterium sp. J49]MBF6641038.1 hypothetical protein [Flavobacterium sp. J49]NIC02285.1 hypothetical protein [Flavobacterium sp. J49]